MLDSALSEGLIADALAAAGYGVLLLDADGHVTHVNRPAAELLGQTSDRLGGQRLAELVHIDDRGWAESGLAPVLSGMSAGMRHEARLLVGGHDARCFEIGVRPVVGEGADDGVRAVVLLEDAGDRAAREQELRRLADTDPLTELLNRRRFTAEIEHHLTHCARYGARGALLVIDLDGLKEINDRLGHLAGDRAIVSAAELLASHVRASDTAARIGGDEFALLLPEASGEQAAVVAGQLVTAMRGRPVAGIDRRLTFSVGIAAVTAGTDRLGLFERADAALYEVKRAGGDGHAVGRDASRAVAEPFARRERPPRVASGGR